MSEENEFYEVAVFYESIFMSLTKYVLIIILKYKLSVPVLELVLTVCCLTRLSTSLVSCMKKSQEFLAKVKKGQVQNSAGGYVIPVSDSTQVRRLLIIRSEKASYYQKA